jgi:hypothetical protein
VARELDLTEECEITNIYYNSLIESFYGSKETSSVISINTLKESNCGFPLIILLDQIHYINDSLFFISLVI